MIKLWIQRCRSSFARHRQSLGRGCNQLYRIALARAYAIITVLTLFILLILLLFYRPSYHTDPLLTRSRANLRWQNWHQTYPVEARTMKELKQIQQRQQLLQIQSNRGPSSVMECDAAHSSHPPVSVWSKKSFTAPQPTHQQRPKFSTDDLQLRLPEWESTLSLTITRHDGDVVRAFYEWMEPHVTRLEVRAVSLDRTDQAVAMIVDGEDDRLLLLTLKHTFYMLGPGWGLVLFHTVDNEGWLMDELKIRPGESGEFIQLQRVESTLSDGPLHPLPMTTVFYERINVETVLFLQTDAIMVRSPWLGKDQDRHKWNHLLANYAYLGAPWRWCHSPWCRHGGSGGVSIRKRSVMMSVLRQLECSDRECRNADRIEALEGERPRVFDSDTFLAHLMWLTYRRWSNHLASTSELNEFSRESMTIGTNSNGHPSNGETKPTMTPPFFLYQTWDYQPHAQWLPFMAQVRQYYDSDSPVSR